MSGPRLVRELLAETDFLARLADAWDGKGTHIFTASGVEHRALLELAGLPRDLAGDSLGQGRARWAELHADERLTLLFTARRVIELGRQCAWIFGEGQGARF
jgi:hypothetical protein